MRILHEPAHAWRPRAKMNTHTHQITHTVSRLHIYLYIYTFAPWWTGVLQSPVLSTTSQEKDDAPRPCNTQSNARTEAERAPARTPGPSARGVLGSLQQQWPCSRSINPLPNITACEHVCILWPLSSTSAPRRPFRKPLHLHQR